MGRVLDSLKRRISRSWTRCRQKCRPKLKETQTEKSKPEASRSALASKSALRPLYTSLLEDLGYEEAPTLKPGAADDLLAVMHQKAAQTGVPLDNPLSYHGFRLGFSEAALAYPDHPVQVKAYIGIFTWLVVMLDDKTAEMRTDVELFQTRFSQGEVQPTCLLRGLADILHEAREHFDPVLANILVTSCLNFVTSNLLEIRDEFQSMETTKAGRMFPYYYRNMAGITEAYAIFTYPKAMYPDMGCFLEAIPDMAIFINIFNDVVSFYKEEVAGETTNYIHNRARCEQKKPLTVLKEVKRETVDCFNRISAILDGREPYAQAWKVHARGHIAMHTVNPRYRLAELGLGEEHPLHPGKEVSCMSITNG